ncbi:MAG: AbrB/MazE/SpoVT family DNA-binding domain-containing protein [Candidatus Tectomicrobia bacterium]|nr:AbrB/MazE/SpoVT family DNA-binding domain-containing protein [Candidatus Tectomicrobia bacterium]
MARRKNAATKVRKIGSSLGMILNRDLLEALNLREGDEVFIVRTADGLLLTPYDPDFAQALEASREFMRQYRDDLKALAE